LTSAFHSGIVAASTEEEITCYGLRGCLTHSKPDPLVEFYDDRYHEGFDDNWAKRGQFVSRYYASTLLDDPRLRDTGLCLMGHVPEWDVNWEAMREVLSYVTAYAEMAVEAELC
jgi:hypothetical protein